MKIYEIDDAIKALVDEETGEVLDVDAFMALALERDAKIENMIGWYKNENAEADALKAEAKALTERAASSTRRADRLKAYIEYVTDGQPYKCTSGETAWRKTTRVEISEDANLADEYMRIKREPDKTIIKNALNAGAIIIGAALVEGRSMSIK